MSLGVLLFLVNNWPTRWMRMVFGMRLLCRACVHGVVTVLALVSPAPGDPTVFSVKFTSVMSATASLRSASCITFASPACVSPQLADECSEFVSNVILGADIIPRASEAAYVDLLNELVQFSADQVRCVDVGSVLGAPVHAGLGMLQVCCLV